MRRVGNGGTGGGGRKKYFREEKKKRKERKGSVMVIETVFGIRICPFPVQIGIKIRGLSF